MDQDDDVNRQNAEEQVEKKFRKPLYEYAFPPRADVCFEDLHSETGNHQDQVKALIEKTASSLDNTALKILFVSVQQNNIDLCVQYAINGLANRIGVYDTSLLIRSTLSWFGHSYLPGYVKSGTLSFVYLRLIRVVMTHSGVSIPIPRKVGQR